MSDGNALLPKGTCEDGVEVEVFYTLHPATGPSPEEVADAIVLIHGWACDHTDWDPVIEGLASISQVVAVDLPGHGGSEVSPSGHSVSAMASSIEALMNRLALKRVVLVGHSAGAEVAAMIAVRFPDRIRAVVSVDPSYGFPQDQKVAIENMSEKLNSGDPNQVIRDFFAQLDDNQATPPWIADKHESCARACRPQVARDMFQSFAFGEDAFHFDPATAAFLRGRSWPLLGIYRNGNRASTGRQLMAMPEDRVYVYEGAGHWLHQEQPDRFTADVRTWLLSLHEAS